MVMKRNTKRQNVREDRIGRDIAKVYLRLEREKSLE
jgi:hypothetical protein